MSTALRHPEAAALGGPPYDAYDTYDMYGDVDVYEDRYDGLDGLDGEIYRRGALLIARRGWCQGQGLLYVGSSHAPQAASLVGALTWAVTGDAQSCGPRVRAVLAAVRTRLDPAGGALFSDWELLCAWNDVPARTRDETIALLLSCHHSAMTEHSPGSAAPRPGPGRPAT